MVTPQPFGKNTFRNNLLANQSSGLALELIDAKLPEPYYGHVFLSDCPSNPCLSDQSSPNANLHGRSYQLTGCKSRFRGGIKAHMLNVVLPELPSGCQNSFREAVAKGKFRSMPNSFLPPSKQKVPGLLFLGDALNMRHPLTGGGMTVAMTYY